MSQRLPTAVVGAENYLIVKHTHDEVLAHELMTRALRRDDWSEPAITRRLLCPVKRWVRILPALPNSFAAAEGWDYAFHEHDHPSRGAFPAVVFR